MERKKHIYFCMTNEVYMIGGKERFWLVRASNKREALRAVGVEDESDEEFGFVKRLSPKRESAISLKQDKVLLHSMDL